EPLPRSRIDQQLPREYLEGDLPAQRYLLGLVDDAHAAVADLAQDAKVTQPLQRQRARRRRTGPMIEHESIGAVGTHGGSSCVTRAVSRPATACAWGSAQNAPILPGPSQQHEFFTPVPAAAACDDRAAGVGSLLCPGPKTHSRPCTTSCAPWR